MNPYYRSGEFNAVLKEFESYLRRDYSFVVRTDKGHATEVHVGKTPAELISRFFNDGVSYSSSFANQHEADKAILFALEKMAPQIVSWMQSSYKNYENLDDYKTYAFTVNYGFDESIGNGFNNKFEELTTPSVKIVLERDYDADVPFGFYIKSAFPDIACKDAEYTGFSYTKEQVMQMDGINFGPVLKESAFKLSQKYPELNIKYYSKENQLVASYGSPEDKIKVYIKEGPTKILHVKMDQPSRRLEMKDLSPEMAAKITSIEKFVRERDPRYAQVKKERTNIPLWQRLKSKDYEVTISTNIKNPRRRMPTNDYNR